MHITGANIIHLIGNQHKLIVSSGSPAISASSIVVPWITRKLKSTAEEPGERAGSKVVYWSHVGREMGRFANLTTNNAVGLTVLKRGENACVLGPPVWSEALAAVLIYFSLLQSTHFSRIRAQLWRRSDRIQKKNVTHWPYLLRRVRRDICPSPLDESCCPEWRGSVQTPCSRALYSHLFLFKQKGSINCISFHAYRVASGGLNGTCRHTVTEHVVVGDLSGLGVQDTKLEVDRTLLFFQQ